MTVQCKHCDAPAYRGHRLCSAHLSRVRRGTPLDRPVLRGVYERFWAKVDRSGECWLWTGSPSSNGYGRLLVDGDSVVAHRVSYELNRGPIPEGLELDHLCRNRLCVNPAHLEPVTHAENMRRGDGWAGANAAKTHCPQGHPYSGSNLHINPKGQRICRACRYEAGRLRRERLAARVDRDEEAESEGDE